MVYRQSELLHVCKVRILVECQKKITVLLKYINVTCHFSNNKNNTPLAITHNWHETLFLLDDAIWICRHRFRWFLVAFMHKAFISANVGLQPIGPLPVREITKSSRTFSATNVSNNIIWFLQLHDTIKMKSSHTGINSNNIKYSHNKSFNDI